MKDESALFNKRSADIRDLSGLPLEELSSFLTDSNPGLDLAAPNIAPHAYATSVNAVQYLNGKLPPGGQDNIQDGESRISRSQQVAWLDLYKTVNDPLSVFEHLENGTLTHEHVEALTAVYPGLHQEISTKLMEELGNQKFNGGRLPYHKRLAVSKFLGMPLDSTMTPASMQAIIGSASANTGPAAQASEQTKLSGPAITQISKVNQLYPTPIQSRQISKNK